MSTEGQYVFSISAITTSTFSNHFSQLIIMTQLMYIDIYEALLSNLYTEHSFVLLDCCMLSAGDGAVMLRELNNTPNPAALHIH